MIVNRIYPKEMLHLSHTHIRACFLSFTLFVRITGGGGIICSGVLNPEEGICLLFLINALFVNGWFNEEQLLWSCSGCSEVKDFQGIFKICTVTTSAHQISIFVP